MIDILYLAWNRLEMTQFSFEMLLRNTDWTRVNRLYVYDDGSTDGTLEFLADEQIRWKLGGMQERTGVDFLFFSTEHRSPVAIMNDYVQLSGAAMFAKIDNDIVVPPGWLGNMLDVMERSPTLDLLGMEAGRTRPPDEHPGWVGVYGWTQTSHIGGVGLIKTRVFEEHGLPVPNAHFGWTEFQSEKKLRRGWITPDLLVYSLDMVPAEPWVTLSERYKKLKWQRGWPSYDATWPNWWQRWEEVA